MLSKLAYVYRLCAARAAQGHLSAARQVVEIAVLMLTRGVGYDFYHYAGMWRRDARWRWKRSFLGRRGYRRAVARLNPRKYHGATQFKPLEKAFFTCFGIPSAHYLGALHPNWGVAADGQPLTGGSDLQRLIEHLPFERLCIKPTEGANGRGFRAFERRVQGESVGIVSLPGGEPVDLDDLARTLHEESADGWIIEEWLTQHPDLARFNPSSLNTIRVFIVQDDAGDTHHLGSFLKTGRAGALIDKTEGGGASVFIDADTGTLAGAFDWSPAMRPLRAHPATGEPFASARIPYWHDALVLARRTVRRCPGVRFAGLDVAITPTGPVIVEVNVMPDIECLPVLGITGPDLDGAAAGAAPAAPLSTSTASASPA